MKMICNVPDEAIKCVKDGTWCGSLMVEKMIATGVPLPKGHGRLIDAREYENSIRKHYFDNSTVIRCTEIVLDNAPTIIEADKEESDAYSN